MHTYEDLILPNSTIMKIMKTNSPEKIILKKGVKFLLNQIGCVFILRITHEANKIVHKRKCKTVTEKDIIAALKNLNFDFLTEQLEEYIKSFEEDKNEKKSTSLKKTSDESVN